MKVHRFLAEGARVVRLYLVVRELEILICLLQIIGADNGVVIRTQQAAVDKGEMRHVKGIFHPAPSRYVPVVVLTDGS